jgi:hypothetical protein
MSEIPCTITCFLAAVILVAMIIMAVMVSYDPFIKLYRNQLPDDAKSSYDSIVKERSSIYFTGYMIGFVLSVFLIIFNIRVLKHKIPISAMVCLTVVVSTVINYFYYTLSPKSMFLVSLLKTNEQKENWVKVYKSMQYYYHISFLLGAVAVGVFTYAFRGKCIV